MNDISQSRDSGFYFEIIYYRNAWVYTRSARVILTEVEFGLTVINMAATNTKSVLFVCLGNICRSPIAEAVFRKMATDAGVVDKWRIDSAATSTYEIGNPPDHRGQACMKRHGVPMRHVARQWIIDSGATSDWNIDSLPDSRGLACLRKHGIETSHRARQVTKEDFMSFEYVLCMDESNLSELNRKAKLVKNYKAKIELLGSYDPQKQHIIKDPYYGSDEDFEKVYEQCVRCCKAFLEVNS